MKVYLDTLQFFGLFDKFFTKIIELTPRLHFCTTVESKFECLELVLHTYDDHESTQCWLIHPECFWDCLQQALVLLASWSDTQ